jgi:hypothetical protein
MNKIELAVKIGEELLEIPAIKDAVDVAADASRKLLKDAMPEAVSGTVDKLTGNVGELISTFDQSGYRFIPVRGLATEARSFSEAIRQESHVPPHSGFEPIRLPAWLNGFQKSTIEFPTLDFGQSAAKTKTIH